MSQLPSSQSSLRLAVARSAYERVRDRLRDLTTALPEVVDVSIARDWAEEFGNIVREAEPLGMTVGSRLRVEAVYLNTVQAASRAGIRFFATSEWVTLAPRPRRGRDLGRGVPIHLPVADHPRSWCDSGRGSCRCSVAASPVVPVEEPASPDFPPVSPAFSEGPPPTPTPVPTPAPTISREPSSNSGVVESVRTEPETRGRGKTRPVAPLPKRSTRKRVASEISRSRTSRCLHRRVIRRERALRGQRTRVRAVQTSAQEVRLPGATAGGPPVKNPAECLACSAANWNCALDLPQESSAPVAGPSRAPKAPKLRGLRRLLSAVPRPRASRSRSLFVRGLVSSSLLLLGVPSLLRPRSRCTSVYFYARVPGAASFRPPVLEPAPLHGSPVLADLLAWRSEVFASSIECAVAAAGQASVAAERDAAKAVLASLELRVAVAADRLRLARQRNDIARDNVNSLQVELERVMARRRASTRRDDVSEDDDDDDDRGDYAPSEGARSDVPEDEDELAGGGDSDEVDADIAGTGSGDMDLS
ncbi:hypothetical protein BJV77DRAFT_967119 [Russula vinacea]|nr:hypothetical protein BJV77DRAFT_967119 [Russula vinacea]